MLFVAVSVLLAWTSTAQTPVKRSASGRPNIIFIYADDLGYGELGCYGQRKIRTPHLDKMASEGVRLESFYSSSALCAPARCQWLTGLHSGHAAVRANHELANGPDSFTDLLEKGQMPLPAGSVTIARQLQQAGYATALIGKWGLGMADTEGAPLKHGFDYFFGYLDQKQAHNYYPTHLWENDRQYPLPNPSLRVHTRVSPEQINDSVFNAFIGNRYSVDAMAEKAETFIRQQQAKPFFLYYALTLPHLALQVPAEARAAYEGVFPETPYLGEKGYCPSRFPRATYAAMVTYLDDKVGELLNLLQRLGLEDNTLVVFSSDNGSAFRTGGADPEFFQVSGPLRNFKGALYEGGIRVPFIARWPGKLNPAVVTTPAAGYDLFATFAEVADVPPFTSTDGRSMWPLLTGKRFRSHGFFYFELMEYGGQQAVRMGDWKAVRRNMLADPQSPWELYDLKSDIGETRDVAGRHPEIVMRAQAIAGREHRSALLREWDFMIPSR